MKIVHWIGAAGLAVGLSGAAAFAQEGPQLVEKVGEWGLYYDQALGGGSCYIARVDGEGRTSQVGADRDKERAFLGLMAHSGSDIDSRSLQNATFDLGGDQYTGEVREFSNKEGIQGGYVWFNNLNFASDLANKQTLKVMLENGNEIDLDLTGSKAAMERALECQIATTQ